MIGLEVAGLEVARLEVARLEVAGLEVAELRSDVLLAVSANFEVAETLVETIILVGETEPGVFEVEKNESRVIVCGHTGKT